MYAVRPASASRWAWSSVSMPSVTHASMPELADGADHLEHAVELRAVLRPRARPRPCRSASRPAPWPASAWLAHLVHAHAAASAVDAGLVVGALGAVAAVLGAAAGLDAQEGAALDVGDVVMARCTSAARKISSGNGKR